MTTSKIVLKKALFLVKCLSVENEVTKLDLNIRLKYGCKMGA